MQTDEVKTSPSTVNAPELRNQTARTSSFTNGRIRSYIIEPQLTYTNSLAKGTVEVLAGTTFQQNKNDFHGITASGFNSDLIMKDIRAASSVTVDRSVNSLYRYSAFFGRINYNWEGKYILNLTGRRDGSSRFGPENLFHNFASVAGAWIFSSEPFVQKTAPFLTFGKLRANYGTTGNDQIGDYQFMSLYDPLSFPVNYLGAAGSAPVRLSNPFLQWEETRKLQVGLDIGVFKERILLQTTYYRNRSSNQLQSYALPYVAGFNSIQLNFPATVQNTGWEFLLAARILDQKQFTWHSTFNLTIPENKLLSYPDLEKSVYANSYVVGEPIPINRAFKYVGSGSANGFVYFCG